MGWFSVGGVEFEVWSEEGLEFPRDHEQSVDAEPILARVVCSLHVGGSEDALLSPREVRTAVSDDSMRIRADRVYARVREIGSDRFVATAKADSVGMMAEVVAASIVQLRGGFVLHAAASAIGGRAVLFIGPSGAGKSTAASLTRQPWFAQDRVVVSQHEGRWWCWPFPGGSAPPAAVPRTEARALPLAAIYRVHRADRYPSPTVVLPSDESTALFDLRESCMSSLGSEFHCLENLIGLASDVPVARLHTRLNDAELVEAIRTHVEGFDG